VPSRLCVVALTIIGALLLSSLPAEAGWSVRTTERLQDGATTRRPPRTAEERTAREIERLLRGPLRRTTTSLFVVDAESGERLFSVRPDTPLNAASNVKLIATAAALDILGPSYRYRTVVIGAVPDDDGVIGHDVYLLGSYDPTLSAQGLGELARSLAARGARRLDGDIVVGEPPSRDGVFRSFVRLQIDPAAPGQPPKVTVSPTNDLVEVVVDAVTVRARRVRRGVTIATALVTDEAGRRRVRLTVSGQVGRAQAGARTVWIRERALLGAHLFRQALREAGIVVRGDVHVATGRDYVVASLRQGFLPLPLVDHYSQPLSQIVQRINKQSTNWLADRVIMTAALRRYGGVPTMEKAVDAMYDWLERRTGIGRDDLVVDTGSGLSYETRVSARQIVQVVRAATGLGDTDPAHLVRRGDRWKAYRASLAVGGRDGTLRHRFERFRGTVLAKTGSLSRVIALSGVLETSPGRPVVFSIITNGRKPLRKASVRRAHERLIGVLSDYLRHE
jgi:D-alanyl-D-alanine carboxypeptidase/D-alanyl-D-alanine-endopeptidase (penicillin-binding protein 4)